MNGLPHGFGVMYTDENCVFYKGKFLDGQCCDKVGSFFYDGFGGDVGVRCYGLKYYGGVRDWDVKSGWGIEYHRNGRVKVRGRFSRGVVVGECVRLYWENGGLKFCGRIEENLECTGKCFSREGRLGAFITKNRDVFEF